ncbi:MAG TPA: SDR family oxidoreductase [Herbaspirillum sp.]|jgi:3-oxoacyl-[acyl-carrier protein] reductase
MKKLIVVTGASKGVGLAISRQLLTHDYRVAAVSRTLTAELGALAQQYGDDVRFLPYDFANLEGIHALCGELVRQLGRPYGLINNAAIGHDGVLATMHERQIGELLRVNLEAPILLSKYLLRPMLLNQSGRIINISSIIASTGFNGLSVYGASKAALSGFTKSLAREVGKAGITVNEIAPGYMETGMTTGLQGEKLASIKRRSPLGRLATVDDVAGAVLYLLGAQAEAVTGTCITVDAGSTA